MICFICVILPKSHYSVSFHFSHLMLQCLHYMKWLIMIVITEPYTNGYLLYALIHRQLNLQISKSHVEQTLTLVLVINFKLSTIIGVIKDMTRTNFILMWHEHDFFDNVVA